MPRKISNETLDHASLLFSQGNTLIEIGKIVGHSPDNISKLLRAIGIDTSVNKSHAAPNRINLDVQSIITMYQNGMSENAIAKHFGVMRGVIRKRFNEAGFITRTQSEAEKLKWSKMTNEQRDNQVKAAHIKATGKICTYDDLRARAVTREKATNYANIGIGEFEFKELLNSRGIDFRYQAAIDTYNIDFLIGSVAVELTANKSRCYGYGLHTERSKNLLKRDIKTLYVVIDCVETLVNFTDAIIADVKILDSLQSTSPKYWMIRCRRQDYAIVKNERSQFTRVDAPVQFFYEWRSRDLS